MNRNKDIWQAAGWSVLVIVIALLVLVFMSKGGS